MNPHGYRKELKSAFPDSIAAPDARLVKTASSAPARLRSSPHPRALQVSPPHTTAAYHAGQYYETQQEGVYYILRPDPLPVVSLDSQDILDIQRMGPTHASTSVGRAGGPPTSSTSSTDLWQRMEYHARLRLAERLSRRGAPRSRVSYRLPVLPPQGSVGTDGLLSISDPQIVLGHGSNGTLVLKGTFRGRDVAVKRMMPHFLKLVARELDILRKSDSHPNIIRYFYDTSDTNFQYIALELCPASLADIIDIRRRDELRQIVASFVPKRALCEITSGLRHLHGLRLVHRDIKPQNILVSAPDAQGGHRMLISDFGLCRQLETGRMSYNPTIEGARAAGTVGWHAPEVLRGEVKLDGSSDGAGGSHHWQLSPGTSAAAAAGASTWSPTRQTQFVDIFALGCLYYYVLTEGAHPFGAGVEVESNILKGAKSLERLGDLVAVDAIERMLSPKAEYRPDATACLLHPCLWDADKVLTFLQEASDLFQKERRGLLDSLENGGEDVVRRDWCALLDPQVVAHFNNFNKRRTYNGRSVRDLLRLVRNAKHHVRELPEGVKDKLGTVPEGFLKYFTDRFPKLFLHVYYVVSSSLRDDPTFRSCFELKK